MGGDEEVLALASLTSHELTWSPGETGELRSTQYRGIVNAPFFSFSPPTPLFQSEEKNTKQHASRAFCVSRNTIQSFFYLESAP